MPNEFLRAYQNNYRNYDGTPGDNYFANYSDYKIDVHFDPTTGKLVGSEEVVYHNNSNDSINTLVIRLYKNLFQKSNPRDFRVNPDDIHDGIDIKTFKINGQSYDLTKVAFYGTNMFAPVFNPILPNSETTIHIEWEFTMPQKTSIRNGKYGDKTYMVAYWYPQIAVYDDVFGWDQSIFGGTQEYYNDHSNFDVSITVPAPNIVWATGVCQNYSEVYNSKYLAKILSAQKTNDVVNILTPIDYADGQILKKTTENTWNFKAEKIPDFAFSTSASHNWDATSISMPDRTQRVLINGVYADSSANFHSLAEVSRKIIGYFSFQKPNIYYPYPAMTVFEGGGGMEYPMMVNQGDIKDLCDFYYVTAHEIGHSYFPFYAGTSETRYAWMDEGLISYFPRFAVDDLFGTCNTVPDIVSNYSRISGNFDDLPLMVPSSIFKNFFTYRNIAYNRPAFAFYILNEYLGDSLFYGALQNFAQKWHYKHPYPYDFFYTFENFTNEDLSWIWKPFFFDFTKIDLALTDVNFNGGLHIVIVNEGKIPVPVELNIYSSDGKIIKVNKPVSCWKNTDICEIFIPMSVAPVKVEIDASKIPDADLSNNYFEF
ncbi:MAG: M1 family metallopeptidase [Bacteroidales bacterium]|nr:M1 family metallopeptidase [Bacteroidales bacterium]